MPTENVTPTLADVAHAQTDNLFDVLALLSANEWGVECRASAMTLPAPLETTQRLVVLARKKVQAAVAAFGPHI